MYTISQLLIIICSVGITHNYGIAMGGSAYIAVKELSICLLMRSRRRTCEKIKMKLSQAVAKRDFYRFVKLNNHNTNKLETLYVNGFYFV